MPKLPGISRATAVRVFTKLGFRIAHDVFLSRSAKAKAVVRPLAERLRQDG